MALQEYCDLKTSNSENQALIILDLTWGRLGSWSSSNKDGLSWGWSSSSNQLELGWSLSDSEDLRLGLGESEDLRLGLGESEDLGLSNSDSWSLLSLSGSWSARRSQCEGSLSSGQFVVNGLWAG